MKERAYIWTLTAIWGVVLAFLVYDLNRKAGAVASGTNRIPGRALAGESSSSVGEVPYMGSMY